MKISEQKIDAVNSMIKLLVEKNDYQEQVDKSVQKIRQKANIPGFRPGKIPAGLIRKMYGKSILAEEINKIVSDNLFKFIRENNLNIIGEPLPNETEQKEIDFDTQEDFEFVFDIGLAPEITIDLSKKDDKINYYKIKIDDDLIQKQIESYTQRYGTQLSVDDEVVENDVVKGILTELDAEGNVKAEGITVEDAVLMPMYLLNNDEKNKFIGAKKGDKITINPHKAYEGQEGEISSFLRIEKEEAKNATSDFTFEITEITRYKEAELNQDLFDKVFGEGSVTSEEEFKAKVKEYLEFQFCGDSDYKFMLDARKYIIEKASPIALPDAFLKRWLLAANEKNTPESIEKEYPEIVKAFIWQLIREKLAKEYGIKVEESDLIKMAGSMIRMQFANYGYPDLPDEMIEKYSKEMLDKEDKVRDMTDRIVEEKLTQSIKSAVTLKEKKITSAEFNKLFSEENVITTSVEENAETTAVEEPADPQ